VYVSATTDLYTLPLHDALPIWSALTRDEQWRMSNLVCVFAGEAEYDRLFDVAGHGRLLIYRDVWMKVDKAVLQADSLIVTDGVIVVNGIKNYSGSHLYQSGRSARENAAALRKYFIADPMTLPETDPPRVWVGNYCCS